MKKPPPPPPPRKRVQLHAWTPRRVGLRYVLVCDLCMVVKRADGQNKPCKGVVRLTLRELEGA